MAVAMLRDEQGRPFEDMVPRYSFGGLSAPASISAFVTPMTRPFSFLPIVLRGTSIGAPLP